MNRYLIIGYGSIGKYYDSLLQELFPESEIKTMDPDQTSGADYSSMKDIEEDNFKFVVICTPNYTHIGIAKEIIEMGISKSILIEKPAGAILSEFRDLKNLAEKESVHVEMMKNSLFTFGDTQTLPFFNPNSVKLKWLNRNRVPEQAWFTDVELSRGGVEVDLLPHLLAIAINTAEKASGKTIESWKIKHTRLYERHNEEWFEFYYPDDYQIRCVPNRTDLTIVLNGLEFDIQTDWDCDESPEYSIEFIYKEDEGFRTLKESLKLNPKSSYMKIFEIFSDKGKTEFSHYDEIILEIINEIQRQNGKN